jgi:hypothetical protein
LKMKVIGFLVVFYVKDTPLSILAILKLNYGKDNLQ